MEHLRTLFTCIFLALPGAGAADALAQMAGKWNGSGWARETPDGPQETVRCKLTNSYEAASLTLTVKGRCVVPGRKLSMSGRLEGRAGSDAIKGRWFNPDGLGSTAISGNQQDGAVTFSFAAKDPNTGTPLSQTVIWTVTPDALTLRATDRNGAQIPMSEMRFTR